MAVELGFGAITGHSSGFKDLASGKWWDLALGRSSRQADEVPFRIGNLRGRPSWMDFASDCLMAVSSWPSEQQ